MLLRSNYFNVQAAVLYLSLSYGNKSYKLVKKIPFCKKRVRRCNNNLIPTLNTLGWYNSSKERESNCREPVGIKKGHLLTFSWGSNWRAFWNTCHEAKNSRFSLLEKLSKCVKTWVCEYSICQKCKSTMLPILTC